MGKTNVKADKKDKNEQNETTHDSKYESNHLLKTQFFSAFKFLFFVAGIYFCYLMYGVYHEDMANHKFSYANFIVWGQTISSFILSTLVLFVFKMDAPKEGNGLTVIKKSPKLCFAFSALYVGGMVCSNESLKHVSYPVQALGKACKCLPIVFFGTVIRRQLYDVYEYLAVAFITAGIILFNLKKIMAGNDNSHTIGLILLWMSLCADGLQGVVTTSMRKEKYVTSTVFMFVANLFGFVICSIVLLFHSSEWTDSIDMLKANPDALSSFLKFCGCSACGHVFIFLTLKHFGPLILSMVTSIRKYLTVIVSILYYNHTLTDLQWASLILVIIGSACEFWSKNKKDKKD